MNERIKELAEQCGFRSNLDIYDRNQSFDIPKFAELIVRECVELVSVNRDLAIEDGWNVDEAMSTAINDIEEHFGVEEQVTESNEWHTCPYAEEIHGDYETLCDCDEEQAYQCSRDI
jgi:hypothetical protein